MKDVDRSGRGGGNSLDGNSWACSGNMSEMLVQKKTREVIRDQILTFQAVALSHYKDLK